MGESELDYVRVYRTCERGPAGDTERADCVRTTTQTRADAYHTARRLNSEKSRDAVDTRMRRRSLQTLPAEHDQHEASRWSCAHLTVRRLLPRGSTSPTGLPAAIDSERDEEDKLPTDVTAEGVIDSDDLAAMEQQLEAFEGEPPTLGQPARRASPYVSRSPLR